MKGEVAVVGGGIAGVLAARLLTLLGYQVTLFERSNRLGGCAGSFVKEGITFNIAATTIGGLFPGFPVERVFSLLQICPQLKVSLSIHNPTFWIKKGKKEAFLPPFPEGLAEALATFGNLKSYQVEALIRDTQFILTSLYRDPFFHLNGFRSKLKTLIYVTPIILKYGNFYKGSALKYLTERLSSELHPDLMRLLNALVMITAQANLQEINAFTLHLALGYTLTGVGSVPEGNEELFYYLAEGFDYYLNSPVNGIRRSKDGNFYLLQVDKEEMSFERVVFAAPILDHGDLFQEQEIKAYILNHKDLVSPYSAITAYGIIRDFEPKAPHCLLLTENTLGGFTSGNYFLSYLPLHWEKKTYSFTLSTHTPLTHWQKIPYKDRTYFILKDTLVRGLISLLSENLELGVNQLELKALATPHTFNYYLGRKSLGGIPVTKRNTPWKIPGNLTPFKGLYLLSDQSLFYQGWMGISLGLLNLFNWWRDAGL